MTICLLLPRLVSWSIPVRYPFSSLSLVYVYQVKHRLIRKGPPSPNTSETSPNTGAILRSEQQVDPDLVRRARRTHRHQEEEKQHQLQQKESEMARAREEVSSGAKPTIRGTQAGKDSLPEGVRRHNEDMTRRYDRAYNQIGDEGKVGKGYWQEEGFSGERD